MAVRRASHANSWYSGNKEQLDRELAGWLGAATPVPGPVRAIICPHAGYSYSGNPPDALSVTVLAHQINLVC